MNQTKVGYHVSKSKGLVKNIKTLLAQGGLAVQFFISPNMGVKAGIPLKDSEVAEILELKAKHGLYTVVHGKYLLNFARPHNEKNSWQQKALITDIMQANRLGTNVIIHQGKNVAELGYSNNQALDTFVQNIKQVLDATGLQGATNKIILENSCQQGTELGYTIEELAQIFNAFGPEHKNRLSFCLDLCHIWVSGTMKVSSPTHVDQVLTRFDELIGLQYLEVLHFNDSKVKFGGCHDRHADILIGYIGNTLFGPDSSSEGFQYIVKFATERNIPLILETPEDFVPIGEQINLLLSWSRGDQSVQAKYLEKYKSAMETFFKNPTANKADKHDCGEPEPPQIAPEITKKEIVSITSTEKIKPKIIIKKIVK